MSEKSEAAKSKWKDAVADANVAADWLTDAKQDDTTSEEQLEELEVVLKQKQEEADAAYKEYLDSMKTWIQDAPKCNGLVIEGCAVGTGEHVFPALAFIAKTYEGDHVTMIVPFSPRGLFDLEKEVKKQIRRAQIQASHKQQELRREQRESDATEQHVTPEP